MISSDIVKVQVWEKCGFLWFN